MNYRTQAAREPSPVREETVELSRFSRAYTRGLLVATILSGVGAIVTVGSTDVVCERSNKDAPPACELVVRRLAFPSHEALEAGPGAVEVKNAMLGDDGEKPHLAVHTLHTPLQWFDPRGDRDELAAAFRRYHASSDLHFSLRIERNAVMSAMLLIFALCFGLPLAVVQRRQRIVVDLDTAEVRIVGWKGEGAGVRHATVGFERVKVESADGDSELYNVVLDLGKNQHVIGEAVSSLATPAAKRLDAILRGVWEEKKKAELPVPPEA